MSMWSFPPELILSPLAPVSLIALLAMIYLYGSLSYRLGAVTKMPPHYRWFIVSGVFIGLALVISIVRSAAWLSARPEVAFIASPWFGLVFYLLPLFVGVVICVVIVWRYWSWLLKNERG